MPEATFYYGRFMDTIGLEVEDSNVVVKGNKGKTNFVIALWNNSSDAVTTNIKVHLDKLNITSRVKEVVDLGAKMGYRKGTLNPEYIIEGTMMNIRILQIAPQTATAINIRV